ncbi:pentapeptide repeat-containing protein [Streptomyces chartreusis]|uniref:pentapeptide repeat-containing protein n=1 Tax=Streptomyces chartreusis TaxID=1969 RepID=UPI0033D0850B
MGVAVWRLPWWFDERYLNDDLSPAVATTVTGVRTALLGIGAGSLAAVGILYTHRTLQQSREGQVTDRYTKAITQLASDKTVEQLGGIYALERIMRDSAKDHVTVVEVLAAFIREHAPAPREDTTSSSELRLREPVQAALTVLGRRPQGRKEPFPINLTSTDLRGAVLFKSRLGKVNLSGAYLQKVNLNDAHLEGASLGGTHLESAFLFRAHLQKAVMLGTRLESARLNGAHLEMANLFGSQFAGADLEAAHLKEADLFGVNLEEALNLTVEQVLSAYPGSGTRLPAHLSENAEIRSRITAVDEERLKRGGRPSVSHMPAGE